MGPRLDPTVPGSRYAAPLRLRVGYELVFDCPQDLPMIAKLHIHHSRTQDLVLPDHLHTDRPIRLTPFRDEFGNWCTRLMLPVGRTRLATTALLYDSGLPDDVSPGSIQHAVLDLPTETLPFLLGSRYCETDRLSDFAWSRFGAMQGSARVQAICDFVHGHLTFSYAHARATRTAWEAYGERVGVCRDFAHLAIALCRSTNIPARYCAGYLGDIGVPADPAPMDFSAWFEVYLDHRWQVFDARHNVPRIGRVLIAHGRDAADAAIATTFGPNTLSGFRVNAEVDSVPAPPQSA